MKGLSAKPLQLMYEQARQEYAGSSENNGCIFCRNAVNSRIFTIKLDDARKNRTCGINHNKTNVYTSLCDFCWHAMVNGLDRVDEFGCECLGKTSKNKIDNPFNYY